MVADALADPWPAPAKLNRFLRIIGRRRDGYHMLQTVFQFLDRCDYLRFVPTTDGAIRRAADVPGVPEAADLALRAALLLQQRCGVRAGATIAIDKRLPIGGGLGGGSSDAATTLVALNHYWRTSLSIDDLADLGVQLGADVPVFVRGCAAWAEGVGEQLTPIALDEPWFVVLVPSCQVSTAAIFNDPALTRNSSPLTMRAFVTDADGNDCEAVVFKRYPEIAAAAEWLARYARTRLTGTGACVFAAFAERQQAEHVLSLAPRGLVGFVSRGCNRSLLQERWRRAKIFVN